MFKTIARNYIQFVRNEGRKDMHAYEYRIEKIISFWKDKSIKQISLDDIAELKQDFLKRKCSPKYINVFISIIRMIFKYANERKHKTIDYRNIKYVPEGYRVIEVLEVDQVKKLLTALGSEDVGQIRDRAIIAAYLDTGMRLSECLKLNRSQLEDIYSGKVTIRSKFDKERCIMFTWSILYIKEYMALRKDGHEALFITSACGYKRIQRLREDWIQKKLRLLRPKLGFRVNPHKLRKTAITNWVNNGMDIKDASFLAGHDSIKTTEKHYLGINWNRLKKVHKDNSSY